MINQAWEIFTALRMTTNPALYTLLSHHQRSTYKLGRALQRMLTWIIHFSLNSIGFLWDASLSEAQRTVLWMLRCENTCSTTAEQENTRAARSPPTDTSVLVPAGSAGEPCCSVISHHGNICGTEISRSFAGLAISLETPPTTPRAKVCLYLRTKRAWTSCTDLYTKGIGKTDSICTCAWKRHGMRSRQDLTHNWFVRNNIYLCKMYLCKIGF